MMSMVGARSRLVTAAGVRAGVLAVYSIQRYGLVVWMLSARIWAWIE